MKRKAHLAFTIKPVIGHLIRLSYNRIHTLDSNIFDFVDSIVAP